MGHERTYERTQCENMITCIPDHPPKTQCSQPKLLDRLLFHICGCPTILLLFGLRNPPARPGTKGNINNMFVVLLLCLFDMCVERAVSGSHLRETCHGRLLNKTLYKSGRLGLTVHVMCLNNKLCLKQNPQLGFTKCQPYGTEVPGWSRTEPKVPGSPKLR